MASVLNGSLLDKVNQIVILDSVFYSKRLRNKETGKVYNIDRVLAEKWTLDGGSGWWIKLLIENNDSHGLIYWQNINCTQSYVREACAKNPLRYEWIP